MTPPTPQTLQLKAIANWLESREGAAVHEVNFINEVVVVSFYAQSVGEYVARSRVIGGEWIDNSNPLSFTLVQDIAPGVEYRLTAARSSLLAEAV